MFLCYCRRTNSWRGRPFSLLIRQHTHVHKKRHRKKAEEISPPWQKQTRVCLVFLLVKTPHQTRFTWTFWEKGCGRAVKAVDVGGFPFRSEGKELVVVGRTSWIQQTQAAVMAFNYTSDLASGAGGICWSFQLQKLTPNCPHFFLWFFLNSSYFGKGLQFLTISLLLIILHQVQTNAVKWLQCNQCKHLPLWNKPYKQKLTLNTNKSFFFVFFFIY